MHAHACVCMLDTMHASCMQSTSTEGCEAELPSTHRQSWRKTSCSSAPEGSPSAESSRWLGLSSKASWNAATMDSEWTFRRRATEEEPAHGQTAAPHVALRRTKG